MKLNGLAARIGRLEEAQGAGELPNGGIVFALVEEGESRDEARQRKLLSPEIQSLSAAQRRKVVIVALDKADMDL